LFILISLVLDFSGDGVEEELDCCWQPEIKTVAINNIEGIGFILSSWLLSFNIRPMTTAPGTLFKRRKMKHSNSLSIVHQLPLFYRLLISGYWLALFAAFPLLAAPSMALQVVTEPLPPYQMRLPNGKVGGMATQKVRKVLAETGIEGEFEMMPWARAYRTAQETSNVLIYSIVRTPEREDHFQWVGVLVANKTYLVSLKKRTDIQIQSLADLQHYTIGVKRDDVNAEYLQEHGLGAQLAPIKNTEDTLSMLLRGRVDVIPGSKVHMRYLCKKHGCELSDLNFAYDISAAGKDFYLAASLSTPKKVVNALRKALDKLNQDSLQIRKKPH